ncbi:MAG: hypothetical protein EXR27_13240 [Betaproteobacteria bacterium]|nr:hypothetical protein [Betaproteobacteria bacterium]
MRFSLFLVFRNAANPQARIGDRDREHVATLLRATPRLTRAQIHTPGQTDDPYLNDGPPPQVVLQVYFAELPDLEAACGPAGHLQALADVPWLKEAAGVQQAMLVRSYAVPDPLIRGTPHCTYLVSYEGPAEDEHTWHAHYLAHHPELMVQFPGIRETEIYTRLDWVGFLPWRRVNYMQRNKAAFDNPATMTAALASPVRQLTRADFATFPPYSGEVTHFPMATQVVHPAVAKA